MTCLFITMFIRHMFLNHTSRKEIMQTVLTTASVSGLLLIVSNGSRGHDALTKSEHSRKYSPIPLTPSNTHSIWKLIRFLKLTSW